MPYSLLLRSPEARQQAAGTHLLVAAGHVAQVLKRHSRTPQHRLRQRHPAAPVLSTASLQSSNDSGAASVGRWVGGGQLRCGVGTYSAASTGHGLLKRARAQDGNTTHNN